MRKTISVLVVCGAFLVGTAPAQAQAAPKDPVRVLKNKLIPGHGVRYTEIANTVTGTITFKDLRKASAWFSRSDLRSWASDTEVSYKLTLNSAGLVSKLWSSYTAKGVSEGYEDHEDSTVVVDTRYTGWGTKVSVKTPNPKTVTK